MPKIVKQEEIVVAKKWPVPISHSVVKLLNPAILRVDRRYQRPEKDNHIKKIAKEFSVGDFGILIVAPRKNGKYYLIDGQQRAAAAHLCGYTSVPCLIFLGLNPKAEAELYTALNTKSKSVHPIEQFKARLFSGESIIVSINKTAKECGYRISNDGGGIPNSISCVKALEWIASHFSIKHLQTVLTFVRATWPEGDKSSISEPLLKALALFFDDPQVKNFSIEKASEKFKQVPALELLNQGKIIQMKLGKHSGHSRVIIQLMALRNRYCRRKAKLVP